MSGAQQVLEFIKRNDGVVKLRELRHFPQQLLQSLERNQSIEIVKIDGDWQARINSIFDKKQDDLPSAINVEKRLKVEKPIAVKVKKPVAVKAKKPVAVKIKKAKIFQGRSSSNLSNLFDFIKASRYPLTIKKILEKQNLGCKNTIYKNICRLIKEEKIVSSGRGKKQYIDKDRAHLLERQKPVRTSIKRSRKIILEFVKGRSQISTTQDVVAATGITKRTVTGVIKYYAKRGDLVLLIDSDRGNKFYFVSADNPKLAEELKRLEEDYPINKVRKILENSGAPMTIGEISEALGKKKRCGGASSLYLKKIVHKLGCKAQKRGNGFAYYLEGLETGLSVN